MKISPAVKVGILTLLSIVILVFGIMWLKGRAISAGERIEVSFQDVDGMRPGSAVQMMGIRIGQVEEIIPFIEKDRTYVKVRFVIIETGVTIPVASKISIQQSGIIGEKFLEITPPQPEIVYMPVKKNFKYLLQENDPVEILAGGKYITIGTIKDTEVIDSKTLALARQQEIGTRYAYKINYAITTPGLIIPEKFTPEVIPLDNNKSKYKLRLTPPENIIVEIPESASKYTVIEPMRLKEFFDLQMKAASALNETNDKINAMLTDDTIDDLKSTLRNIKTLTAKANTTMDKATILMETSRTELETVVLMANNLSNKLTALTDNVNDIIGDPKFKKDLISTADSVNKSTKQVSEILTDPKVKETLALINSTTKDLAEISSYFNGATKDQELKAKFDKTLTNLNVSLDKLSTSLDNVNSLTSSQETKLKQILDDTSDTSKNLKKFSEKLNKRFLLIRLLVD